METIELAMSSELPEFEFENVLHSDVEEIFAARKNALVMHHARDIGAAGDEVEETVRRVLRRKLSVVYYVGHGHLVDKHLKCSPQLDVIIASNTGTPVLFQARNGSEYFPYETVYAIGEVKSAYYKEKRYIHEFAKQLTRIQSGLQREHKATLLINHGEAVFGNPLLSFMVFVQSNDFEIEQVIELYQSRPASELPSIIYFLDKGLILNANIHWLGKARSSLEPLSPVPPRSAFVQFVTNGELRGRSSVDVMTDQGAEAVEALNHWIFTTFDADKSQLASNFGSFYFLLATHLDRCTLTSPNLLEYLNHIFGPQSVTIIS